MVRGKSSLRGMYEEGELSLAALAAEHGVSVATIKRQARRGGWKRRRVRGPALSEGVKRRLRADYERGAKWAVLTEVYEISAGRLARLVDREGWNRDGRRALLGEVRP